MAAPILRVRTVTAFVTLKRGGDWEASIAAASSVLGAVKRQLERCGLEVQTTRLATNNFTEFIDVKDENSAVEEAKLVEDICARHDISFVSLGGGCGADFELAASLVGPILSATSNVFLNLQLESFKDCEAASQVIESLQRGADTEAQSHCFRFTACCRCKAGIPFFPAAHWSTGEEVEAPVSFAVGLENSGLLYEALEASAGDLDGVAEAVRSRFETELEPIRRAGNEIAGESGANFLGGQLGVRSLSFCSMDPAESGHGRLMGIVIEDEKERGGQRRRLGSGKASGPSRTTSFNPTRIRGGKEEVAEGPRRRRWTARTSCNERRWTE